MNLFSSKDGSAGMPRPAKIQEITPPPLPAQIVMALSGLIRRTRRLVLLRGLCASCTAGIGAFLLIMLLDAGVTLLEPWPRWLMTGLAYSTWVGATIWFLIRPLMHAFTLAGIARLIETHHPELQERISSAVQLLSSRDLPSIRGSDTLIAALTEEAVREAVAIQPRREISFRGAIPFVVAAVLVVGVLATAYLVRPRQTGFLLARAAAPFLNLPNVQAMDLVIEPGDTLIAAGSSLQVSLRTANPVVTSARLRQVDRQGHESVIDMVALPPVTNQPGRRFTVTLPGVMNDFRYRVHAGDALSRYFTARVATPPVIEHLDIRYRFPEYSRLGVKHERDGSGTIRALAGTEVTISAEVNKPARQATLQINSPTLTNSITGTLRTVGKTLFYDFSLSLPKGLNGGWTLRLTDEINLTNSPFEHSIQAIPDNPPVITVTSPLQKELRLNRTTRLPVSYRATDDLGLTALAMVFTLPGSTNDLIRPLAFPASTTNGSLRLINGETTLVLEDPLFTGVPRLSFRLRAWDTRSGASAKPQSSDSETITLLFDNQAESWTEQVLASQEQRVQQGLKQVQQKLAAASEQARTLNNPHTLQQPLTDDTTRKIDTLQDTLAATDNALRDIAADIDKGFFEALASNLTALAENHVSKAENMAGQIRLVDTPAERMAINSNITAEIATSQNILERAIKDHELARSAVHRAVELDQLAEKQAALAQTRQNMENAMTAPATNATATAQTAAEKEWQKEQDRVADDLAKLARENRDSVSQVAADISNRTTQASVQAMELAHRQTELAAATKEESDRLQKLDTQWHELAARQNQLAELARNEPLATAQNEAMRQAARDLEAGKKEPAIETQSRIATALHQKAELMAKAADATQDKTTPDPAQELAARAAGLKAKSPVANQQPRQSEAAAKTATQQAAQQAREAAELARQADQLAGQKAEQASQAAQQAEQQTGAAKQTSEKTAQTADQAARQAEKAKGQANEQELNRAAEAARQNALAAQQSEEAAREIAQQAKHSAQAAAKQAQRAKQAALAAQQAAQRASDQAQKAASATSKRATQQAQADTAKATDLATANALTATEAAVKASDATARTRQQTEAMKLTELARQQDEIRRDTANLITEKKAAGDALRTTLSQQITQQQRELADEAEALARELNKEPPPTRAAMEASRAAEAARQAATEMQKGAHPEAGASATEASKSMGQLAKTLQEAAQTTAPGWLDKRADLAQLARRADALSDQEEHLAHLMGALAANKPLEAMQAQQEQLGHEVAGLTQEAEMLRSQAEDILPQSQAGNQAALAAQELARAAQSAEQAAKRMQGATGQDASGQTHQLQQNAVQSLQQAASRLKQGAQASRPPSAQSAAPASPVASDALAQAYQAAREAAETSQAAAAAQSASQLAQAAVQAEAEAQSKGANARPATLQSANPNSKAQDTTTQASDGVPAFARRMGLKLQDWLRLHGELKDDVLQAASTEGPEEYRTIIQQYFHEVSGHGEEE